MPRTFKAESNKLKGAATPPASRTNKPCAFEGCSSKAKPGGTPCCKAHGGGKRCIFNEGSCGKSADGKLALCKAHGGGKRCQHALCTKSAAGKTSLCKAHGGGNRCLHEEGCNKSAQNSTSLCINHGGGNRCTHTGCKKSARGGTGAFRGLCRAHGGGKRCNFEGCNKSARGSASLCTFHWGGKRCESDGCGKSAQGVSTLCISHGGGRRCAYVGCDTSARGAALFCRAHGGGKHCQYDSCSEPAGAGGSSSFCAAHTGGAPLCQHDSNCTNPPVLGTSNLCKAHGGGTKRLCLHSPAICVKHMVGATKFSVSQGGGKRCQHKDGCTKSTQGPTDLCVRHGGGKRCEEEGCHKSVTKSGFCSSHARSGTPTSVRKSARLEDRIASQEQAATPPMIPYPMALKEEFPPPMPPSCHIVPPSCHLCATFVPPSMPPMMPYPMPPSSPRPPVVQGSSRNDGVVVKQEEFTENLKPLPPHDNDLAEHNWSPPWAGGASGSGYSSQTISAFGEPQSPLRPLEGLSPTLPISPMLLPAVLPQMSASPRTPTAASAWTETVAPLCMFTDGPSSSAGRTNGGASSLQTPNQRNRLLFGEFYSPLNGKSPLNRVLYYSPALGKSPSPSRRCLFDE